MALLAVTAGACGRGTAVTSADEEIPKIEEAPKIEEVPKIVLGPDSPGFAADADISPPVDDGTYLSDLTFDQLDGGTGTIAAYQGTPLVVNFFASWCPPCVREMPEFQDVFEHFDGRVAFLGLSQDQTPADALELVEVTGVTYDVGWDPDLEVYRPTGSIAMPTTAFVSADGRLADVFAGALDADGLTERIETALGVTTHDRAAPAE